MANRYPETARGGERRRRAGRPAAPASRITRAAAGRATRRRPSRRFDRATYETGARQRLRRFRQASVLAVALTAMLLFVVDAPAVSDPAEAAQPAHGAAVEPSAEAELAEAHDPAVAVGQATRTIRDLALQFYGFAPRLVIVLLVVGLAWAVTRLALRLLRRTLHEWPRVEAASAIARIVIAVATAVAVLSVLAGDSRAVVGSVGLLGLAASWALQTPIESFTGWLLNSLRGYYRVGDRIAVGEVFGDVYRIDVLTTTVWEAGGAGKPVSAAQSTGALITFPNWEVLRSNIVNYSRDYPYVWDEVTVSVANESDLRYAVDLLETIARRVFGDEMTSAALAYEQLLRKERLEFGVEEVPRVYVSGTDSWTDCTIRYLVPVRTRRAWSTKLLLAVSEELAHPAHHGRVLPVYPRREVVVRDRWPGDTESPDDGRSEPR